MATVAALVVSVEPLSAQTPPPVYTDMTVRIESVGKPASVDFQFHRPDKTVQQLLVTNVSLASGASPAVESIQIDPVSSVFTGWFLVQPNSREAWIGTQLPVGHDARTVSVPVVQLVRPYKSKHDKADFEFVIGANDSRVLRGLSGEFQYAPLFNIELVLPLSLRLVDESNWSFVAEANGNATYRLKTPPAAKAYSVKLEDASGELMKVINEAATPMFGTFSAVLVFCICGSIFLVKHGMPERRIRLVLIAFTSIVAVLLALISNSVRWDLEAIISDGRFLVGALGGLLLPTLAPKVAWENASEFMKGMKSLD